MRLTPIWTLYCHTHVESGRRYIGLTRKTMMHRWHQHVSQAKCLKGTFSHFINAINKYGKDAFLHEVLAQSWTLEGANATEQELIVQYKTQNPEMGFNVMRGGDHVPLPIRRNPWDRPDFRAKMQSHVARMTVLANTPSVQAKAKATRATPEYKEQYSILMREIASNPETKARRSAASKRTNALPHVVALRKPFKPDYTACGVAASREAKKKQYEAIVATGVKICKNHGPIPLSECQKIIDHRRNCEWPRYACKHCLNNCRRKRKGRTAPGRTSEERIRISMQARVAKASYAFVRTVMNA